MLMGPDSSSWSDIYWSLSMEVLWLSVPSGGVYVTLRISWAILFWSRSPTYLATSTDQSGVPPINQKRSETHLMIYFPTYSLVSFMINTPPLETSMAVTNGDRFLGWGVLFSFINFLSRFCLALYGLLRLLPSPYHYLRFWYSLREDLLLFQLSPVLPLDNLFLLLCNEIFLFPSLLWVVFTPHKTLPYYWWSGS